MGLDLIREMFANATKWKMNTVRIYAHTTDPEHPFMVINLHCRPCLLTYGLFRAYKAPSLLCSRTLTLLAHWPCMPYTGRYSFAGACTRVDNGIAAAWHCC